MTWAYHSQFGTKKNSDGSGRNIREFKLKGRQWTVLDIAHPVQNDDVSCGVYILKVIHICLNLCIALNMVVFWYAFLERIAFLS